LGYTQEKSDLIFLTLPRRTTLMGKRNKIFVMAGLTLGGLLLIGSPAGAQTYYHPPSDQREDYQQQRIQQGIDSGALTPGEARYLDKEQARIQATEDRMRADGHLSPWERQRLRQMQNQASRDIYRLDHNGRTAEGWNGNHDGWGNHWNSGGDNHPNHGWNGHQYADWDGRRPYDPRYDHRDDNQKYRIQHGIHNGALSPGEARYLERQQGHIQNVEDRMRADGRLSPWERERLNHMQNRASRDIYRLDHNGRTPAGYSGNQAGWQGRGYGSQGTNMGNYGTTPSGAPVTGAISTNTSSTGTNQSWQGHHGNWNGTAPSSTATNGTTTSGFTTGTTPTSGTTTAGNTQSWQRHQSGWNGASTSGTTTGGTATANNTQGWQGHHYGGNGYTPAGTAANGTAPTGTTTAGNTRGWRGNYARNGQPGAFRQPGPQAGNFGQPAQWQGQPRFQQQARPQFTPNMMRPNGNFMARQPGGFAGRVNRASYSPRRR
jgi:hypothetical protein